MLKLGGTFQIRGFTSLVLQPGKSKPSDKKARPAPKQHVGGQAFINSYIFLSRVATSYPKSPASSALILCSKDKP